MANKKNEPDIQSRWKYRYYEALDELEEKEKTWREAERLLRQLISRLTLAADTRHRELNKQLTELRNAVRDGRDILRLRELIDGVSEQVAELDKLRKQEDKRNHPATLFIDVLEQIELPDALSRDFRNFKKQVKQLSNDAPSNSLNDEFVSLLKALTDQEQEDQEEKPNRRQKLLDRILSRQNSEQAQYEQNGEAEKSEEQSGKKTTPRKEVGIKLVAPAVGDLLLQLSLRLPDAVKQRINFAALKKHTNRARARKDLLPIIDVIAQQIDAAYAPETRAAEPIYISDDSLKAIVDAVAQFFEQLDPPIDLKERIVELEKYFSEKREDVDGVIHCLNALADVVHELCERLAFQKDELESFFVDLGNRLQDLDAGLQQGVVLNNRGQENNQKMDQAVHDEIQGIQESMPKDSGSMDPELVNLRSIIQARLNAIDKHLQVFQDDETARYEESNRLILELTEKVQVLEVEGDKLRDRLQETQQQAFRDILTGIPNRQAYEERIANEIARSRRYQSELCLVVWDVDKFKSVNDNYGHAAGDKVLKVVAETLMEKIRATDFLARFGGEEFVLLLPETNLADAQQVADKLRELIAGTPFHFRDSRVPVTISGGIAQLKEDEHANDFFERADKALYRAKENGRNRVELAG